MSARRFRACCRTAACTPVDRVGDGVRHCLFARHDIAQQQAMADAVLSEWATGSERADRGVLAARLLREDCGPILTVSRRDSMVDIDTADR